jgi:hypothetical protein
MSRVVTGSSIVEGTSLGADNRQLFPYGDAASGFFPGLLLEASAVGGTATSPQRGPS